MFRPRPLMMFAVLTALLATGAPALAGGVELGGLLLAQSKTVARGPGFYLNLFTFIPALIIYVLWVYTTHWVHADTKERNDLNYEMWNGLVFGAGLLGLVLAFVVPVPVAGVAILLVAWVGPLWAYIAHRNALVAKETDKVMTGYHIGEVLNEWLALVRIRPIFNKGDEGADKVGPPVFFLAKCGADGKTDPGRLAKAEESEQYISAKELIYDALQRRTTDIHLEPTPELLQVRYRIDGMLQPAEPFDRATGDAVLNIFKVLSGMNIAERRKPQDGSFAAKVEGREIDFRVATSGTKGGEKMVLRILDTGATVTNLDEAGMRPKMVQQLRELLQQQNGMILFAGPTGSGKSTTLYACLRDIDRFLRNVVTLEDPIEYQIDNVQQREINPKIGEEMGTILRSVLRQDPDVIMIGEIRDEETAQLACQAATTGHLVLSTVHANDAITALRRMYDLGADPDTLASALSAILAQRLVRVLCETCKEPYKPKPEFLRKANLPPDRVDVFYKMPDAYEQVCPECGNTGHVGRTGIFELLVVNDALRDLIRQKAPDNAIKAEARKNGMIYLDEDGLRQVIQGRTSIKELMRVVK
jgi:general secretion pathway protein E